MKDSCKSLDVFEFREEDELTEVAARSMASKFRNTRSFDHEYSFIDRVNRGSEIHSKGICCVICEVVNVAHVNHNCDAIGSFNPSEIEDYANKKIPESNCDLPDNIKIHSGAAEIESNALERESGFPSVECSLSPGATSCLKDQTDFAFLESSFNDELACVASESDECQTSSDGPSPQNCFSGWDLADDMVDIVFYPDYVDYHGILYPDSAVSFSRSFVEVKSKTTHGIKGSFHLQLEIDDIVKIESQWSARYETGTINIYFISKGGTLDDTVNNASGIHELKFPAVDSKWYEKLEAIESLDLRYKALWLVMLDIGMEKCSVSPEWQGMMLTRRYFPNFDKPFDEVIYPKGDPDAVSISKRDIDLLQPDTFVNDTIIDFYIKYLKNRQNVEDRIRFHFFNSFFFRKLADMDKDPSSAFDGKAAFQHVRKWTRKVNLLEKDFIFIPVNYNYHWSLIVICYFGEIASNTDVVNDKLVRVPCILHMDSLRGSHGGLKDLMQSYLWEEWKERQKETCEDLSSKFRTLKFISLELPQQQNLYDCGLFLLHYVELFLEDVPANFNIHSITSSSNFLQADWFPPGEASMKRAHIERLINELLQTYFEDCSPSIGSDADCSPTDLNTSSDYDNRQGIEMTLLPASSINSLQCARNSRLIKDLFEPACSSRSYNDVHSLDEMSRGDPLAEEEMDASEYFVQTKLAEPAFQHPVGLTHKAPLFPYTSREIRLEPDSHAVLQDADSSSATSSGESDNTSEVEADEKCQSFEAVGLEDEIEKPRCILSENIECSSICIASASAELINAEESFNHVGINDHKDVPLILKNFPDFYQGTNQMRGNPVSSHELLPSYPPFAFGGTLDNTECESPDRTIISNDHAYPCTLTSKDSHMSLSHEGNAMLAIGVDGMPLSESYEMRAAKRMRAADPDEGAETTNLSNGLNL